jgi:conjugative relaxase-like TrwC/TraI family protein
MLSIGKMRPDQAAQYFEQDNYYQQKKSVDASEWLGEGAKIFGLAGPVDPKMFAELCHGNTPDGKTQLRLDPKTGEPVAGLDCTFSAPKSLSLAALVGGDMRLIEAHDKAVKAACAVIEARYLRTWCQHERVEAIAPIIAMFAHDTSRELDPQLHTHCFFLNLVQTLEGKWQSLANEKIYEFKMLLGQIYRNELAKNVEEIGYRIEPRTDGLFEIEGYTREQILGFSERHNQILNKLAEMGLPDTTENRIAALFQTRKTKEKNLDRAALKDYWVRTAEQVGLIHPTPGKPIQRPNRLDELVAQAVRHCETRRSVFPLEAIERYITQTPTGKTITQIDQVIARYPGIIYKDNHYATKRSLERERETIALMQVGQSKVQPIGIPKKIIGLTEDQSNAVTMALKSRDRVIGWCGVAGAGKTYTVQALIASMGEFEVIGLAPDASAAQTLQDETRMSCSTVASMLASKPEPVRDRLVIVDEAGKLSAQDARALLERSQTEGFRLLLIGDPKQLSAVEAGSPFKALLENGMAVSMLNDFLRQKNSDLNLAVQLLYNDWGRDALKILESKDWITEHKDFDERMSAIAYQWLNSDRKNTRIVAGTHLEREAITSLIRAQLKAEQLLGEKDYGVKALRGKDLSDEQIQHARNYAAGDVLIPGCDRHGLKKSRPYSILAIEGDKITLVSGSGVATVDMSALTKPLLARVYEQVDCGIAIGDHLRWTQNNHALGRVNGREFSVMEIEADIVRVRYDNGKRDQFSLNQLQHLDHGLIRTTYSSQGMTCENIIISMGNDASVCRESILVGITRAKQKAEIFCASLKTLHERVQISNAQPNIKEWLESVYKIKPQSMPQYIDTADLRQKFAAIESPPKIDPLVEAARQKYSQQYAELAAKLWQPGVERDKLDTAIALASGRDAAKVLYFSPANNSAQPQEIERYLKKMVQRARRFKEKQRQAEKPAVKAPRTRI